VTCPSEALVGFQWITLCYVPEHRTHHVQTFVNVVVTLLKIVGTKGTLITFNLRTLTEFLLRLSVLSLSLVWIFYVFMKVQTSESHGSQMWYKQIGGRV
jgi:hypothetical protein